MDWHELSLHAYIKMYGDEISFKEKINLSIQVILIVIDLHRAGIVHRDLKPSNFMVDDSHEMLILKLIDFGDSVNTRDC